VEDPPAQVRAALAEQVQALAGRAQLEVPQARVDPVRPHPQQAPPELAQQVLAGLGQPPRVLAWLGQAGPVPAGQVPTDQHPLV
jgi:hypothetical protein